MRPHKLAFTLIEMSIVVAIIALVVGAIMAGNGIAKAQKMRLVLTDATTYAAAYQQFILRYDAVPGDHKEAQKIWGNASGGAIGTDCTSGTGGQRATSASISATNSGKPTCNGTGDGKIDATSYELYRAWQQLFAAELITGLYCGISSTTYTVSSNTCGVPATVGGVTSVRDSVPGVNVPVGALTNSGYSFDSLGIKSSDADYYDGTYDNIIVFGTTVTSTASTNGITNAAAISGKEAFEADRKMDDGLPATGNIRTYKNGGTFVPTCATAGSVYAKSLTAPVCSLIFLPSFGSKTGR